VPSAAVGSLTLTSVACPDSGMGLGQILGVRVDVLPYGLDVGDQRESQERRRKTRQQIGVVSRAFEVRQPYTGLPQLAQNFAS